MCTIFSLRHVCWNPVEFSKNDVIGGSQCVTDSGCLNATKEYGTGRIRLETIHGGLPFLAGHITSHYNTSFPKFFFEFGDHIQMVCKDNNFAVLQGFGGKFDDVWHLTECNFVPQSSHFLESGLSCGA